MSEERKNKGRSRRDLKEVFKGETLSDREEENWRSKTRSIESHRGDVDGEIMCHVQETK